MKSILASVLGVLVAALPCGPAFAWSHANYHGGETTHEQGSGSTTRTNAWGGSETHTYGEGTTATDRYGQSAYHPPGGYYGGAYPAYHPPTTVNYYGAGCRYCGGWNTAGAAAAGAAVGMAAGAAAAGANSAAAQSNAYAQGYAAGAQQYAMGAIYATLPAGCAQESVGGGTYYLCGNTWFSPNYGANGVYYRVVPTP